MIKIDWNMLYLSYLHTKNTQKFQMTAGIKVGNPPTTFEVLIDTGSSNLVVGARNVTYKPTKTSVNTGDPVFVSYGAGSINGTEFLDDVILNGVTAVNQSLGVPMVSSGFVQFDGILGLGPSDLTVGTLVDKPQTAIPTLTETLAIQKKIASPLVALTVPIASNPNGGSIDFGAPNPKKFISDIKYTPVLKTGTPSLFWGLTQSITYGSKKIEIMNATTGFVDSGTSLLLLPTPAYQAYVEATNATFDNDIGLLKVDDPKKLQSLYFHIGDNTFEFTPNAQIFPHSFLPEIGADPNSNFLIIADAGPTISQEFGNNTMYAKEGATRV
ncbi:hypothetical protein Clacol_002923 [Clathrus columnatus]|uniref:Peptidase A1 domain-containing protein n=1 Tax=Clathrus columnatus TaxID=1419009 RepID=A0AAV5A638_9AGAM|nr:hypothetical protein Clacol_002923 [Clathrus columnatus]